MSAAACDVIPNPSNDQVLDCIFGYVPSRAPAGLFLALFFLAALVNLFVAISRRSLVYCFIVLCCAAEAGGYIARLLMINSFTRSGYIAETVLLLVTPSLLAIANYHLIAQMLDLSETATATDAQPVGVLQALRNRFSLRRHLVNLSQPRTDDGRVNPAFASSLFNLLAVIAAAVQGVGIGKLSDTSATQSEQDAGNRPHHSRPQPWRCSRTRASSPSRSTPPARRCTPSASTSRRTCCACSPASPPRRRC